MSTCRKGITIAGSLIADVFYEIDTYPDQSHLTVIRDFSQNIGGSGNIILDLAKLDPALNVAACALIGQDEEGKQLLDTLAQYPNIDTQNITIEGKSAVTIVMNAADTKQRTFFVLPASCDVFNENYIRWDTIRSKIFHLEYLLLMKAVDSPDEVYGTHGARILHHAQERDMMTSIDMVSEQSDRAKQVVTAALRYTDICCINEFEAEGVTGIPLMETGELSVEATKEALRSLRRLGVSKWAVIHAPKLSCGYDCEQDHFICVPSLNLPDGYIKGSTGAGDAYCSGILYGAHEGWTLEAAMRLARAAAACSLSENNGTDGMRTWEEALELESQYQPLPL